MNPFTYPNANENLKRSEDYYNRKEKGFVAFQAANTSDASIISYGFVNKKKRFKITFHDERYYSWKIIKGYHKPIGESYSLDDAINLCEISL